MRFLKKKKFNLTEEELNTLAAEVWDKAYFLGWQECYDIYNKNIPISERLKMLTPNPYQEGK